MIDPGVIQINRRLKMPMKRCLATTDRAQFWAFESSVNVADSLTVTHGKYRSSRLGNRNPDSRQQSRMGVAIGVFHY
jgi:hypothetical protein